ncbi:formylglycine-generating enzyme family protein [Thiohalocapsa sp. ML1]|uniref:formylglycine-generating enzyme family protein n=1 Tax=Thiohalocapsa sp. ML1 TaxID=1431688 RepID=UPI000732053D|nr:formylglycine-generating enzyme family protein [Thiohalocapsa sp. ML1]
MHRARHLLPLRLLTAPVSARWLAALLWLLGLGLGWLAFRVGLGLSGPGALLFWLAAIAAGLLLALRVEPLLDEAAPAPAPPEPPAPPRPPPLFETIAIPAGGFRMGSEPASAEQVRRYAREWAPILGGKPEERERQVRDWLALEQPVHAVQVSAFRMARTPITRGQWLAVMPSAPDEWAADGKDAKLPATHIDWPTALAFCNALSARDGLQPCYRQAAGGDWHWDRAADGWRLPTEAEWEYACRAGTATLIEGVRGWLAGRRLVLGQQPGPCQALRLVPQQCQGPAATVAASVSAPDRAARPAAPAGRTDHRTHGRRSRACRQRVSARGSTCPRRKPCLGRMCALRRWSW